MGQQPAATHRPPLGAVLARLRTILQAQGDALSADDFAALAPLFAERERLVRALGLYGPADMAPTDRALLEQLGALDQRLIEVARSGMERTTAGLREVHRGRAALHEYRRRGQNLIRNLAYLDRNG
jgi:hypothetical protein